LLRVQIGDHISQIILALESHDLKTIYARLMDAAGERFAGLLARQDERDDFAAARAAGDDQVRVLASSGRAVVALDDAEIARQLRLDARGQIREPRTQIGGHLAGGVGLLGILAEDGALQVIAQTHFQHVRQSTGGLPQDGFLRVHLHAQDACQNDAKDNRGRRRDRPQAGTRARRRSRHGPPDLGFQTRRHGCGAYRRLQLCADTGARFEFGRALRTAFQMPLQFAAGCVRQRMAEIGIQLRAHLAARGAHIQTPSRPAAPIPYERASSLNCSRSSLRPRLRRLITVPMGTFSMPAISL
jgi:hypothetical protein